MRYDFRVRLRLEREATTLKLLLELSEVLDNAVVHHRHRSAIPNLRVGVILVGSSVRRPAGMPHPSSHPGKVAVAFHEGFSELVQVSGLFDNLYPARDLQRQSRRIIAPVLQVLQAVHEYLDAAFFANVTYYATHRHTSLTRPALLVFLPSSLRIRTCSDCVRQGERVTIVTHPLLPDLPPALESRNVQRLETGGN